MKNAEVKKNLLKVFKFYSSQQSLLGKSPTFASIEQNVNTLSKGKFLKFCLDFSIGLEQAQVVEVFNRVSGFNKEMSFLQFLNALEKIRGKEDEESFYLKLGVDSLNTCMGKCKPFSKKNGKSLPELPPLIQFKRGFPGSRSTKNSGNNSNVSKGMLDSFKARNYSNLPSAAIVIPMFSSRGGSYQSRYGNKASRPKHWDEINKIDSNRVQSIYGDLCLGELIIQNQSDDEELEKFGY